MAPAAPRRPSFPWRPGLPVPFQDSRVWVWLSAFPSSFGASSVPGRSLQGGAVRIREHGVQRPVSSPPTLPWPGFSFRGTQFRGEGVAACTRGAGRPAGGRVGEGTRAGVRLLNTHRVLRAAAAADADATCPAPRDETWSCRPPRPRASVPRTGGVGGWPACVLVSRLHLHPPCRPEPPSKTVSLIH